MGMVEKVRKTTSRWTLAKEDYGYRVLHDCVAFGRLHIAQVDAVEELETRRSRAALEAMLEPTPEQIEEGFGMIYGITRSDIPPHMVSEQAALTYQAMIRKALEEE